MSALGVMETPSSGATLLPSVPEKLTLKEVCQLISERSGHEISYGYFRAMWAADAPPILSMKRAKGTTKERGDWQVPMRQVLLAADRWPRLRGPDPLPQHVQDLILRLRTQEGMTYQAIADRLGELKIPTRRGHERWEAKTVHWVVTRAQRETNPGGQDGNQNPDST